MATADLRSILEQGQDETVTGMSRRHAMAAGGLIVAGAAGLGPAASPSASSSSSPIGVVFGADRSGYPGFHRATPLAVGARWYFNIENQFPPGDIWPHVFQHTHMTLSLRPNPQELFAGKFDKRLEHLIASAPDYSELTFWHENTSYNPLKYPSYVNNPHTAKRLQEYGHSLCKGSKVLFGVITVGEVVEQIDWIAPGLDWYGDDFYEFPQLRGPHNSFSKRKILERLAQNHHAWRKVTGLAAPPLRICEINSPYNAHRSELYSTVAYWLARHNGNRMLTYWNAKDGLAQGGLDGPWPPSPSVIKTLVALAKRYDWRTLPTGT